MNECANGGTSKGRKSKPVSSNAANSTKASLRTPQRITTVQKLHLRLLEASAGASDRYSPAGTDHGHGTGPAAPRPGPAAEPPDGLSSRDSSPGIDLVRPPLEPADEPPPPPPPPREPARRTAAQILRELARCRSEQEEEMKRIAALEFVPEAEEVVNKKAIELEEKETLDRAERRMLALLSLENSIVAKEKSLEHKKKLGDKVLREKEKLRSVLADLRRQEQVLADQVRRAVAFLHRRAREAVSTAIQQRVAHARRFGEQTQFMVQEAQKQKEEERQQRAVLIRDIRQLENTPLPRFKELDLTETAGHGLLDEMSIVELRERLALLNMQRSAELREKNKMILQKKRLQEKQMEVAEEVLRKFHQAQDLERRQRKERSAQQPRPVTSDRLHQLQSELQEKRAERLLRAARRRAERRSQRHLLTEPAAPLAAGVRSAPPAVGRTPVTGCVSQRRTMSDSCVRLGGRTQGAGTGKNRSVGSVARNMAGHG